MIDSSALLADAKRLTARLVEDLRERTEQDEESRISVRGIYDRAVAAERTAKTYEEWREDLLAQVAAGWVLASVFVRFCEDNGLVADPLLSGPGTPSITRVTAAPTSSRSSRRPVTANGWG